MKNKNPSFGSRETFPLTFLDNFYLLLILVRECVCVDEKVLMGKLCAFFTIYCCWCYCHAIRSIIQLDMYAEECVEVEKEYFHNWLNLNLSCLLYVPEKVLNTCLLHEICIIISYLTFLHGVDNVERATACSYLTHLCI
jgi:hypothetical protein